MSFSDLSDMSDADFKVFVLRELSEITVISTDEQSGSVPRHPEFYVTDLVTLNVGNTVFRVEGHLLAASPLFRVAMAEDEHSGDPKEECITISNVSVLQMECFLEFLYYPEVKNFSMLVDRAAAALQTASMLNFERHHDLLLDMLKATLKNGEFTPQDLIFYARRCRVMEWLTQAYIEIVCREDGLDEEEAEKLGREKILALYRVREKLLALRASEAKAKAGGDCSNSVAQDLIREAEVLVKTETCLNQQGFGPAKSSRVRRVVINEDSQCSQHPEFYFTDELHLITLKIQGVLFRIPRQMMQGAGFIEERIDAIPSGHPYSTDKSPLELGCEALQEQDFQIFLRVVSATHMDPLENKLSLKEWIQALKVATLIEHDIARKFIVTVLERNFKREDPIDLQLFS